MTKERNIEEKNDKINKKDKISKRTIIIGIVVAIILIGVAYQFYNKEIIEKGKKTSEILNYKKAFYEAVICQYSCPLKLQDIKNVSQLLPDAICVKTCNEKFKKSYNQNYTKEDLYKDNLFIDMAQVIQNCGKESMDLNEKKVNNTIFFSCSSRELKNLNEKYPYI